MKRYNNPADTLWDELVRRPQIELGFLDSAVKNILHRVKTGGDAALRELTLQYDKVVIQDIRVTEEEIDQAEQQLPEVLKDAIRTAATNIETFHAAQRRETMVVETMPGVRCWRKAVPVEKVGIYIPGGSAPLFSTVLMLGIPARLAGCGKVVLATPPDKEGKIHPAILFAAKLVGIKQIFRAGGAQAIAGLAFGTESIPPVYKIFGPGNQYVTKAKQLVMEEGVAIDMPAGPSEVLVFADHTANPRYLAADLLSQAEHGEDSQVMLVATDEHVVDHTELALETQIKALPRRAIAERALENSRAITFASTDTAIRFINAYAPEHLILSRSDATALADRIINAGSVFLGAYTPEAAGDYASGTNHTLPTNGYAKAYAGVSLESFLKYITFQEISADGLRGIGPVVEQLAAAEALEGHRRAITIRLDELKKK